MYAIPFRLTGLGAVAFVASLTFACRTSGGASSGTPQPAITGTGQTPAAAGNTNPAPAASPGLATLDKWCAMAAAATAVKGPLSAAYGQLCNNGQATVLFANNLITSAYAGSGTPMLLPITPVASSGSSTAAVFAAGIKLPITAKQYFDSIGPLQGDRPTLVAGIQQQKATPVTVDITADSNSDPFHTRGWTIHSAVSSQSGLVPIITESIQTYDDYELLPGTLYLRTNVTQQAIKTIQDYSVLTALIQLDSGAYLLSVANVKINNLGFPATAEAQITSEGQLLIESEYNLAAKR